MESQEGTDGGQMPFYLISVFLGLLAFVFKFSVPIL